MDLWEDVPDPMGLFMACAHFCERCFVRGESDSRLCVEEALQVEGISRGLIGHGSVQCAFELVEWGLQGIRESLAECCVVFADLVDCFFPAVGVGLSPISGQSLK